jgi:hypothetical protein
MAAAAKRKKLQDEKPDLPKQAQVGDRIRLKPERMEAYTAASKAAGYDFDLYAIRVVTRQDGYNPGGGRRLFVEGAPHCFASYDVNLAWNTEEERREELKRRGWAV